MTDQSQRPGRVHLLGLRMLNGQWVETDQRPQAERLGKVLRNGDILTLDEAAAMLQCNKDFLYRLNRRELPVSKVGKRLFYERSDLLQYVRANRDAGTTKVASLQSVARQDTRPQVFDPVRLVKEREDQFSGKSQRQDKNRPIRN